MLLEEINRIKECTKNTVMSDETFCELRTLMQSNMSFDEEYCTVMILLGRYYEQIDNKNACTYCCLRANEIYSMNQLPIKKRNPLLQYTNYTMDSQDQAFIREKIAFMKDKYAHIVRSLVMISFLFGSCIFLLSYFIFEMNFLGAILQWVCFSCLTYFLSIKTAKNRYYLLQSQASGKYLEECDKEFDQHYY